MDFTYDDEQDALREAVRGLLGKAYGDFEARRRTVAEDPGFSEDVWRQLAEMGVLGLPFAEDHGGMGAGPIEVGIVAEEIGRVLAPEPFLTSVVLAGDAVARAGSDEQRSEVLGALSEGSSVLAFAHHEPASTWSGAAPVTATEGADGWTLSGVKEPVVHGARADLLVVSAALPDDGGTGLFLVAGDASGLERDGYPTHDGGRAARVTFADTPATPLGDGGDATAHVAAALDTARIAACHEALGLMEGALTSTTSYLTSRKQFGVTLNTFQALNFRAADMYVSLELARSLVAWATMVLADPDAAGDATDVPTAAARAALQTSRAGRHIGQEAIQLHGGIGVTAEYSVGNRTSRLTALDHLFGDGTQHVRVLSSTVGDHGEVDPLP